MKNFLLISLGCSAYAFQHGVHMTKPRVMSSVLRGSSAPMFYPNSYVRAVECATHFDYCDIDELEQLAQELEEFQASETGSQLQQREDYIDTLRLSLRIHDMLEKQSSIHDHRKIPSFVEMLEQTMPSQVQDHHSKAMPSFLDMLEVVTGNQQKPKESTNQPPLFLDMLKTITGNNRRQKPYTHAIRHFVDMLKEVMAIDDIIQPQQKRAIPSFLEMLNQTV